MTSELSEPKKKCFLCTEKVEHEDPLSFIEDSTFVMLHILEVPHWENLTTRSKFNETVYCPPCAQKIKEIKKILEDLSELEKLVLERKQEVERQLRESWEKVRKENEGFDPEDRFREQVVTELNSSKLLTTLTRIQENRVGRKFCRPKKSSTEFQNFSESQNFENENEETLETIKIEEEYHIETGDFVRNDEISPENVVTVGFTNSSATDGDGEDYSGNIEMSESTQQYIVSDSTGVEEEFVLQRGCDEENLLVGIQHETLPNDIPKIKSEYDELPPTFPYLYGEVKISPNTTEFPHLSIIAGTSFNKGEQLLIGNPVVPVIPGPSTFNKNNTEDDRMKSQKRIDKASYQKKKKQKLEGLPQAPINKLKRFFCPSCGAGFSYPGGLTRHMKLHTGGDVFNCQYCTSKLVRADSLARHTRQFHSDRLTSSDTLFKKDI